MSNKKQVTTFKEIIFNFQDESNFSYNEFKSIFSFTENQWVAYTRDFIINDCVGPLNRGYKELEFFINYLLTTEYGAQAPYIWWEFIVDVFFNYFIDISLMHPSCKKIIENIIIKKQLELN